MRCLYRGLMLCSFAMTGSSLAAAPADGNTLVLQTAQKQAALWLNPDGSYREFDATTDAAGDLSAQGLEGNYELKGSNLCLHPVVHDGPVTVAGECFSLHQALGDQWQIELGGKPATASWRAGRADDVAVR